MAKSGYDFYLDKCLLPIAPQKLQIKINNANKTLTLMNQGQVNILKTAELTDIEFECEIPQVNYPFATYKSGFKGACYFLDHFENLKTGKRPFQFIVSRTLPNGKVLFSTDIKVSMESYTMIEQAKNGFDLTVKIALKEWRDYGTKYVTLKTGKSDAKTNAKPVITVQQTRAADTSPAPKTSQTYTVAKGDCLWIIAKRFYGSGAKYTKIYEANKATIGDNPNLIYAGQVLTIPAA